MLLTVTNTLAYYDSEWRLCVDATDSIKHSSLVLIWILAMVEVTDSNKHFSLLSFWMKSVGGSD